MTRQCRTSTENTPGTESDLNYCEIYIHSINIANLKLFTIFDAYISLTLGSPWAITLQKQSSWRQTHVIYFIYTYINTYILECCISINWDRATFLNMCIYMVYMCMYIIIYTVYIVYSYSITQIAYTCRIITITKAI